MDWTVCSQVANLNSVNIFLSLLLDRQLTHPYPSAHHLRTDRIQKLHPLVDPQIYLLSIAENETKIRCHVPGILLGISYLD
mgnify:FL=1